MDQCTAVMAQTTVRGSLEVMVETTVEPIAKAIPGVILRSYLRP